MDTRLIDGRALAAEIRTEAAARVKGLGFSPGLAVILVGDDQASKLYVGLKEKACAEAGIRFEKFVFPSTVGQKEISALIAGLNSRDDIDAVLVQLPLPPHLDEDALVEAIDPGKDADGFHPANLRGFLDGASGRAPGLVSAIVSLAEASGRPLVGLRAAVVANSPVFAAPVKKSLDDRGCRTEIVTDLAAAGTVTRDADLVVIAVGKPGWLTRENLKPGAVVIDVGTNRLEGRTVGDAADLAGIASAVTPVPGGVGPMTVAMLIRSVVELAVKRRESARRKPQATSHKDRG